LGTGCRDGEQEQRKKKAVGGSEGALKAGNTAWHNLECKKITRGSETKLTPQKEANGRKEEREVAALRRGDHGGIVTSLKKQQKKKTLCMYANLARGPDESPNGGSAPAIPYHERSLKKR